MYKWIERSQGDDPEWYLDMSLAPPNGTRTNSITSDTVIVQTREEWVRWDKPETRYAYHGAVAIHQRLDQLGYRLKPHPSTINRVLKRNDLIDPRQASVDPTEPKVYYPDIRPDHPGQLHELDLVTPDYISGYGRVISVNRVDVFSSEANLDQFLSKAAESIIQFVINDWKEYAKPSFLKIDNESSFRGSRPPTDLRQAHTVLSELWRSDDLYSVQRALAQSLRGELQRPLQRPSMAFTENTKPRALEGRIAMLP